MAPDALSAYCTVTFPVVVLLSVTVKLPLLPSAMFISFTVIVGALSLSVIVAAHVASLTVAFADGEDNMILNDSSHSYIVSCRVTTRITPVVAHATIVAVPPVYV